MSNSWVISVYNDVWPNQIKSKFFQDKDDRQELFLSYGGIKVHVIKGPTGIVNDLRWRINSLS